MSPKNLVAIPAYNEEVAIGSTVLRCLDHADEVLVVDDGSHDSTAEVARRAGAAVLRHAANMGKGAAVRTALDYARAKGFDSLVLLDGDGQHDPEEIPGMLALVLTGEADIACGFRCKANTSMPLYRRFGKRILDYLTALGAGGTLTDSQCGFRALSRAAIEALYLEEDDFGIDSEMLIEAREKGLRIREVPVHVRYDVDGSTLGPFSHGFRVVDRLLKIIAVRHSLFFFGLPGLVLLVAGVFLGVITLDTYNQTSLFPIGYALLVAIFLINGGIGIFVGIILNVLPRMIEREATFSGRRHRQAWGDREAMGDRPPPEGGQRP